MTEVGCLFDVNVRPTPRPSRASTYATLPRANQTFAAVDAMDNFRAKSIQVMGQNNTMKKEQIARADQYLDRTRQQQAREASQLAMSCPVTL